MKRSEALYRWLLRLYPREFRDEYGDEMLLLFRDQANGGVVTLWRQVLADVVLRAPKEHWIMFKQDVRYALRKLWAAPLFTAAVTLTLALGIGANALVFSGIEALLLRDAPVADPDTLVEVYTSSGRNPYSSTSYPDYFDLRDSNAFKSLAAYAPAPMTLDAAGDVVPVSGQLVSANYFRTLGLALRLGRDFMPDEDRIGAPLRVAIISHALWQRLFGEDTSVIGDTVRLNGHVYTLVGVAPAGFTGLLLGAPAEVWVPAALQPEIDPASAAIRRARGHAATFDLRGSRGLNLIGRLPSEASVVQVRERVEALASTLQGTYPDTNKDRLFTLAPLGEGRGLRVASRPMLLQLSGAVLLILILACVNIAGLLLARSVAREREVAVRVALGASRTRLMRQWLTESVLLGLLGSAAALGVVIIGRPLLYAFVVPQDIELSLNYRVLAFTLLVGMLSSVLFGLAPANQTRRQNSGGSLRDRGPVEMSARATRMRGLLVVAQFALSLMLLVGAGLFLRTLHNAYDVDLGYSLDQTLVVPLDLEPLGYFEGGPKGADAGLALYERILSDVEELPGVAAAAAARMTVLTGRARSTAVSIDGRPLAEDESNALGVRTNVVSDRYFATMNIPIIRGRGFEALDRSTTPRVAVVSQSLADRLGPREDPLGKVLWDETGRALVIGIVPDTVYTTTVERDSPPMYYLLLAQNYESGVTLHVRSHGNPSALEPALRRIVRQADGQLAVQEAQVLGALLAGTLKVERTMATAMGLFGALALTLSVVGLYGVMAQSATSRKAEIGLRLALGAQRSSIVTLLLGHGARLIAAGVVLGLIGSLVATRYIQAQLFGVSITDPLTFIAACGLLVAAGLAASVVPALRAMKVDPAIALRQI